MAMPDATLLPGIDAVLPRLAAAYESGRLVPFIGSGMSRTTCSDWTGFVDGLGAQAGLPASDAREPADLVRRANEAVRRLKGGPPGRFEQAVRAALRTTRGVPEIPPQTRALAALRWPLALTTNYDSCFAAAFAAAQPDAVLSVVGRSAVDCQRVLGSLSTAGRPLLWALQGHLADEPVRARAEVSADLGSQLVVGHEEYRRVTYRELHFRRAFAEVFRQRSLLFLGAGLKESYLQELFGEVLETFGPATRPHYAIVPRGEVDAAFLLARFQIVCVEYDDHGFVVECLERLRDAVRRPSRAPLAWSWGRVLDTPDGHWREMPDFEIVRGPLPVRAAPGECLAVSAGGSGDAFFFSAGIHRTLAGWKVPPGRMPEPFVPPYLGRFGRRPVYAVRARDERDSRSLAHVYHAALALFEAAAARHACIRLQLLAAGGIDKTVGTARWKVQNFPARFSLVQIVRAWGTWRRAHPHVDARLALHVVDEAVLRDVASGRIDVMELLACADMRFFAEIEQAPGELERRLMQVLPETRLGALLQHLQLDPAGWQWMVSPPAGPRAVFRGLTAWTQRRSIEGLGVVPGSTLHFRRAPPRSR